MRLSTLIKKLEKEKDKYLKEHGKEPSIREIEDNWDDSFTISLYGSKKNDDGFISYKHTKTVKVK